MAFSTFLKNALLDHYLGGAAYTQPVPRAVAVHVPNEDDEDELLILMGIF